MLAKEVFVFYLQAVFLKVVLTQCIGTPRITGDAQLPTNVAFDRLAPIGRVVGGNLIVDTAANEPNGLSGVSIFSDDIFIEGNVLVTGNLPFLGTVALEGIVPATGSSAVAYECGTGNVAIADRPAASGIQPKVPGIGFAGGVNRLGRF